MTATFPRPEISYSVDKPANNDKKLDGVDFFLFADTELYDDFKAHAENDPAASQVDKDKVAKYDGYAMKFNHQFPIMDSVSGTEYWRVCVASTAVGAVCVQSTVSGGALTNSQGSTTYVTS